MAMSLVLGRQYVRSMKGLGIWDSRACKPTLEQTRAIEA